MRPFTPSTPPVQRTSLPTPRRPDVRARSVAVGTDGSVWGVAALDWALRHAWLSGGSLEVYPAENSDEPTIERRLDDFRWVPATVHPANREPVSTLLYASMVSDLLVLGCRGTGHATFGLGRSVLPVLAGCRCDVVVVRGEPRAVCGEHGWVTAAVGGRDDEAVLRRAVRIATRWHHKLRVVHARPLPPHRSAPDGPEPADVLDRARSTVSRMASGLGVSLQLVRGQPHDAIRGCTRTDLLVLGGGRPSDTRPEPGPLTRTALHLAPCPVLVVRS